MAVDYRLVGRHSAPWRPSWPSARPCGAQPARSTSEKDGDVEAKREADRCSARRAARPSKTRLGSARAAGAAVDPEVVAGEAVPRSADGPWEPGPSWPGSRGTSEPSDPAPVRPRAMEPARDGGGRAGGTPVGSARAGPTTGWALLGIVGRGHRLGRHRRPRPGDWADGSWWPGRSSRRSPARYPSPCPCAGLGSRRSPTSLTTTPTSRRDTVG